MASDSDLFMTAFSVFSERGRDTHTGERHWSRPGFQQTFLSTATRSEINDFRLNAGMQPHTLPDLQRFGNPRSIQPCRPAEATCGTGFATPFWSQRDTMKALCLSIRPVEQLWKGLLLAGPGWFAGFVFVEKIFSVLGVRFDTEFSLGFDVRV
jgi:hypothetical protein